MISFNQDIATALDRAIVKITDKFLEPPIMITISHSDYIRKFQRIHRKGQE